MLCSFLRTRHLIFQFTENPQVHSLLIYNIAQESAGEDNHPILQMRKLRPQARVHLATSMLLAQA